MKILILTTLFYLSSAEIPNLSPKTIGGYDADIKEFPAVVALIHLQSNQPFCSGTLISKFWILTAAHCYVELDNFSIEYGTTDIMFIKEQSVQGSPELFIQHELFDYRSYAYDIGLIKVKSPAITGLHTPFSKLAIPGSFYPAGTVGSVAGWGIWNFNRTTLQKADLEVLSYKNCEEMLEGNQDKFRLHYYQICAGVGDYSRNICAGDSGSPLYVNGVQIGIASWSAKPCGDTEYPGVFTDVSYFIPWITENAGLKFKFEAFLISEFE